MTKKLTMSVKTTYQGSKVEVTIDLPEWINPKDDGAISAYVHEWLFENIEWEWSIK